MAILEARGVSKRFGGLAAVSDVSFDLHAGEILGLIGPNGSGKTTLVNVLTGALPASAGDVRFAGVSLRGVPPHEIGRRGVSRTFQVVKPFRNLSVADNVMVGALFGARGGTRDVTTARRQAEEILDFVGLAHRAAAAAEGLNVPERKRMELARALAMRPRVLMLDEVMAGLNPAEIDEAVVLIKRIRERGVSLIVIEHVMKAIRNLSDRILVLYHGERLTEGAPEAVLNDEKVIAAYLGRRYAEAARA
ncbi:MAG TPA: ABC transporter ATP-binding protein [Candidatus Binatia bacterium]|nr:ABC transporter ATP-binding protein [Candidatus Binatia bacterium]